jgi:hypothetical protein
MNRDTCTDNTVKEREVSAGTTFAQELSMKFDVQAFRRNSGPSDQTAAMGSKQSTAAVESPRPSTRKDNVTERIEALLRAHPSIVHEIE